MTNPKPIKRFMVRHTDGTKSGPFTSDELRSLAMSGDVERADEAQLVGKDKWHLVSSIKGLFPDEPQLTLESEEAPQEQQQSRQWTRAQCPSCDWLCNVNCGQCGKADSYLPHGTGFQCECENVVFNTICPNCSLTIYVDRMQLSHTSVLHNENDNLAPIANSNSPRGVYKNLMLTQILFVICAPSIFITVSLMFFGSISFYIGMPLLLFLVFILFTFGARIFKIYSSLL